MAHLGGWWEWEAVGLAGCGLQPCSQDEEPDQKEPPLLQMGGELYGVEMRSDRLALVPNSAISSLCSLE